MAWLFGWSSPVRLDRLVLNRHMLSSYLIGSFKVRKFGASCLS